jgi:hypothetical protein
MNAIELLRKKLLEEENARKTEAQENLQKITPEIKSVPRELINEYFDTVVIPAFEQIKNELSSYPFKVFIRKQIFTAQLTVREDDASTYFKVSLKNNEPMLIELLYQYGSRYVHHRTDVIFFREQPALADYRSVSKERLLELFIEHFIIRHEHPEKLRKEEEKKFREENPIEPQNL